MSLVLFIVFIDIVYLNRKALVLQANSCFQLLFNWLLRLCNDTRIWVVFFFIHVMNSLFICQKNFWDLFLSCGIVAKISDGCNKDGDTWGMVRINSRGTSNFWLVTQPTLGALWYYTHHHTAIVEIPQSIKTTYMNWSLFLDRQSKQVRHTILHIAISRKLKL